MAALDCKFDSATLPELETVIERGTWEVGSALTAIRERKLYLKKNGGQWDTFEDYCEKRWGFTHRYAEMLIGGTRVFANLKANNCSPLPANEAQARPIASLPTMQQAKVWREAVRTAPNGNVTARHVQDVVERHKPKRRVAPSEKQIDTRVYLCLDYDDAEWSAQEIARALSGHAEFIHELIDALEAIVDLKE